MRYILSLLRLGFFSAQAFSLQEIKEACYSHDA